MNPNQGKKYDLLEYLVSHSSETFDRRIPTISEISKEMGISASTIREQMEVAKALGFVEARTKTGIRLNEYRLKPAVIKSLDYGIRTDPKLFDEFSSLRKHLEAAYWDESVSLLGEDEKDHLTELVHRALEILNTRPTKVPHAEHKELHLTIFSKLDNPLVTDLLESYWELYERSGLNIVQDINYLNRVWNYHKVMVDSIIKGNFSQGKNQLLEHFDLIQELRQIERKSYFE